MDTGGGGGSGSGDVTSKDPNEVLLALETVAEVQARGVDETTSLHGIEYLGADTVRSQECCGGGGETGGARPEGLVATSAPAGGGVETASRGDNRTADAATAAAVNFPLTVRPPSAASFRSQPAVLSPTATKGTPTGNGYENCYYNSVCNEFVCKVHAKAGPFGAVLLYFDYVRWLWIATDKQRLNRVPAEGTQVSERIQVRDSTPTPIPPHPKSRRFAKGEFRSA